MGTLRLRCADSPCLEHIIEDGAPLSTVLSEILVEWGSQANNLKRRYTMKHKKCNARSRVAPYILYDLWALSYLCSVNNINPQNVETEQCHNLLQTHAAFRQFLAYVNLSSALSTQFRRVLGSHVVPVTNITQFNVLSN